MKGKETSITAEEMAALDENCGYYGLVPLQLMENAGAHLAAEIQKRFLSVQAPVNVTIVAGKGNNGGDAFVAARHLHGKPLQGFRGQRGGASLFDVKYCCSSAQKI
jgi:hydroxyethylthiazole kinase-like uncharacterized protein yjeF